MFNFHMKNFLLWQEERKAKQVPKISKPTQNFVSFHLLAFIFLFHYRCKSFSTSCRLYIEFPSPALCFVVCRSCSLSAFVWSSAILQWSSAVMELACFNFDNDRYLPWCTQKCDEGLSSMCERAPVNVWLEPTHNPRTYGAVNGIVKLFDAKANGRQLKPSLSQPSASTFHSAEKVEIVKR